MVRATVNSVNLSRSKVEYRKDGMDVFKSPRPEMIATTNNFPSSKKRKEERQRLFRKSSLLLIYLYKDESG
jgi:hypothetical protein